MIGTPHYMSPEQGRCAPLDERSDIYSLGVTYFALLTGRPPFNSPDTMQVLFAHSGQPVPDPRRIVPGIPANCVAVIRKAMEKNRAQRHASAAELLADLESIAALLPANPGDTKADTRPTAFVWSGANPAAETDSLSLAPVYPAERSASTPRPKRRRALLGIGVLLLVVACIGVALVAGRKPAAPIPQPEPAPAPAVPGDWPSLGAEADKAIRARNAPAMKRVLASIEVMTLRSPESAEREAIRQTKTRLEKALAFRESITERGLVLGLDGPVTAALLSPDDRLLAIGQAHGDGGAVMLDGYTGEKRPTLWLRRGGAPIVRVQGLAFDSDSVYLAAVTGETGVKLVHIATGKESTLEPGPGVRRALAVAFSPASRNLVAGLEAFGEGKGKPYAKAWTADTGKEPFPFKAEHSGKVAAVAFTAGGLQVATGSSDKRVVMWNAETGRIWRELHCNVAVRALACSPDGRKIVVAGLDAEASVVQFWDYAADKLLTTKPSPHGSCNCVAFSRDGLLVVTGSGSRVLLWNAENVTLVATLTGHSQDVTAVAFSADGGVLVTGSSDQTARLWDITRHLPTRGAP